MGMFSKVEEMAEKFIEGLFRGKKSFLQPVEIAKKLEKEMDKQQRISVSKTYVPNRFTVSLSPTNKRNISSLENSLSKDIIQYLTGSAKEKGYYFTGKVVVEIIENKSLGAGELTLDSFFSEDPLEEGFATNKNAELVIVEGSDEGITFSLKRYPLYIGRNRDNEIFIDDPNVSRKHALIDFSQGELIISDLNSLNGTFVNDEEIKKKEVENGDLIRIGTTLLRYRVVDL